MQLGGGLGDEKAAVNAKTRKTGDKAENIS